MVPLEQVRPADETEFPDDSLMVKIVETHDE
jgi:hypothetical protein